MNNALKINLTLSLVLHLAVFLLFSLQPRRPLYITMPIELSFSGSPPPPPAAAEPAGERDGHILKPEPKDDVVVPKPQAQKPLKPKLQEKPERKEPEPKPAERKPEAQSEKGVTGGQPEGQPGGKPGSRGSGQEGGPITLDAVQFPYAYYTNQIRRKIWSNWQWASRFGRLRSLVFFRISRGGELTAVEVRESSGDSLYDQQALRAVQLSSPFPPLPSGYSEESLGVFFEFKFKE